MWQVFLWQVTIELTVPIIEVPNLLDHGFGSANFQEQGLEGDSYCVRAFVFLSLPFGVGVAAGVVVYRISARERLLHHILVELISFIM